MHPRSASVWLEFTVGIGVGLVAFDTVREGPRQFAKLRHVGQVAVGPRGRSVVLEEKIVTTGCRLTRRRFILIDCTRLSRGPATVREAL